MIKQVIWSSMIDYPKHISTVIFFEGCNFNCSYCYNKELSKMSDINFDKDILPKLLERKPIINHIILSGGECTASSEFEYVLSKLYENGFKIGIHTNGSMPQIVEKNIDKISFMGIDIKTSQEKYNSITKVNVDYENIVKTINLAKNNNIDFQCRTTLFPKYVQEEDCIKIASQLKNMNISEYTIQQYYNVGSAEDTIPYTIDKIKEIQNRCNQIIKTNLKVK